MLAETETATLQLAEEYAASLNPGDVVTLYGELGAGKTTFVRGIANAFRNKDLVQSPTFTYLNIYEASIPLYHFDLYRIKDSNHFLQMGFLDFLEDKRGICLIEWPERIPDLLRSDHKEIHIQHKEGGRTIEY